MASTDTIRQDFRLHSRTLEVGEVQVVVQDPVEWRRHLGKFTREFIGETDNARRCTILNPEVLSFRVDSSSNSLIAFSDSTLRIENSAFGYRIYVILDSFSWKLTEDLGRYNIYPRFEELQPRDADQAAAWAANRRKSYEGSFPHFLSALAAGQVDERGFAMYTSPMNPNMRHHVAPDELGRLIDKEGPISKMSFTGWLEVDYRGKGPSQKSYIRLNQQFALLDSAGVLLNPTCIEMVGQWSRYRVGDQLPFR
jgi:hypothetical protein